MIGPDQNHPVRRDRRGAVSRIGAFILSRRKRVAAIALGAAVALLGAIWFCSWRVERASGSLLYDRATPPPVNDVGLVLGTIRRLDNGRENRYFTYRVEAAAELFHQGKVRHLLVSGDNSRKGYDEPSDLKSALLERGVPASAITLDYAGFRTLDSVVRAKQIFDLNQFTIISQKFHCQRAIYLAKHHQLDVVAYCARDVGLQPYALKQALREALARFKAVLDIHLLRTQPRFLGRKEPITISQR